MSANPPLGAVRVWRHALSTSFRVLNEFQPRISSLLDAGGGNGQLYPFVHSSTRYVLLDRNESLILRSAVPEKIVPDVTAMPFRDGQFDLIVSVSTMQYVDHLKYLLECRRVLCPGGTLALHDNGSLNPFILVARWVRKFRSAWDKELRSYNATIKNYLDRPPQLDGFLLTFQESYGLLSPMVFILELLGAERPARWLEPGLVRADATLLKLPAFRRFAWFRVFHLRKVHADAAD